MNPSDVRVKAETDKDGRTRLLVLVKGQVVGWVERIGFEWVGTVPGRPKRHGGQRKNETLLWVATEGGAR